MCKHGDTRLLRVPIPAYLSHTGEAFWMTKPIDACIAPLVRELIAAGIYTANCCCGHGKGPGSIVLHSGIEIVLRVSERS